MKRLINWVEIPASDLSRAKKFYSAVLHVEFQEMNLGETRYALFPSEDSYNCGALAQGPYYKPSADGVAIYLDGGDDLNRILSRITDAGGQVIMEKTFLSPEAGYMGMFLDSEGNRIGLQHM